MEKYARALRAAFPHTIPILAGFGFLGMTYGIYMSVSGFSVIYPMLISLIVYGGSLQFVAVSMLLAPFAPVQTFVVALLLQARHLFYGIAMLDRFKDLGWKRFFLIFGMSDETFSVNYTAEIPEDVDNGLFLFFVTALNYLYWFTGSTIGGLVGSLLTFNTEGLDFVMTAMFVVIFMEQLRKEKKPYTALIGLGSSLICLLIFGADSFLIPSMICILTLLTVLKDPMEKGGAFS